PALAASHPPVRPPARYSGPVGLDTLSGSIPGHPEAAVGGVLSTVLLVCHANTCRSVMAHVLLEKMLGARGVNGSVRVRSGGIANHARDGMIPSLDARIVLREDDIHLAENAFASTDLRRHREIVAEAHLIVTMTGQQKAMIAAYEEAQGRP